MPAAVGRLAGLREHRGREPVRGRDEPAGDPAADEQREPDERVDQPGEHADRGEPRLAPQPRPVFPPPRRDLGPGELLLDEPQVQRPVAVPDARPRRARPASAPRPAPAPRPGACAGCRRRPPTGCTAPGTAPPRSAGTARRPCSAARARRCAGAGDRDRRRGSPRRRRTRRRQGRQERARRVRRWLPRRRPGHRRQESRRPGTSLTQPIGAGPSAGAFRRVHPNRHACGRSASSRRRRPCGGRRPCPH